MLGSFIRLYWVSRWMLWVSGCGLEIKKCRYMNIFIGWYKNLFCECIYLFDLYV